MSFEYFDADGNAVADGVFLPVAALPGLNASELAASEPAHLKLSKSIAAVVETIYTTLSPTNFNKLGFTTSKASPAGAGTNLINQNYGFTTQKVLNFDTDTIGMIPEPATGTLNGLGSFSISDVFPSATKVAAGGATGGAGVLIPTTLLLAYSSLTHAGITISGTSDNRDWFAALFDWFGNAAPVRDASTASAVTARSAGAPSATSIPTAFTQSTNPTSGILASEAPSRGLVSKSYSITIQYVLNQSTQTFDVNSVTA